MTIKERHANLHHRHRCDGDVVRGAISGRGRRLDDRLVGGRASKRSAQHGITIDGDSCCHSVHTAYHPDDAPAADLAIVLTKAYKTIKAAEVAAKTIKPDGLALTLQNGLGNIEILSEHVGRDRALQGVTMQGATLLGAGAHPHQRARRDASGLRPDRAGRAPRFCRASSRV